MLLGESMNICIDTREKGRKLRANLYYNDKGHNAEVRMLDVGDYLFDDRVVFEYKDIGDFMSSIVDESLFNEAARNYLNDNWYYVSNKWGNDYGKYLSSNLGRYYGALRRLRTFTTPIECHSEENAFQEMLLQSVKCLDGKSKFYSNVTRPVPSQDPVDILLCSAKGVSSKKAEAIRKHHSINTIYDLMKLTVNDFKEVDGFGEKSSNNVYEFIHKGEEKK